MAAPQTSVLTKMAIGFPGMLSDSTPNQVDSWVSGEASAEIPFGQLVKRGSADGQAVRLTAGTDVNKFAGVVLHSHAYAKDTELGDTGLKPKVTLGLLRKGRCLVAVDEAVNPTSPVRVRCTDTGGTAGTFRTSSSAGNTILISAWARFVGSTTGAGTVELEVDLANANTSTAD